MDELRECPFCGGSEFRIDDSGKVWTGQKYTDPTTYTVRHWCERKQGQPETVLSVRGKTRQDATDAWNTRTSDARIAALEAELTAEREKVARLVEACDGLEDWLHGEDCKCGQCYRIRLICAAIDAAMWRGE